MGKDIDATLKKDEKVSDKSWGWSPQDTLIRSDLGSSESEHHKFSKRKTQFYSKIHLSITFMSTPFYKPNYLKLVELTSRHFSRLITN